jgi:hypothetical protein
VLAGVIDTQVDDLLTYFPGFAVEERRNLDIWIGLVLRRPAGAASQANR